MSWRRGVRPTYRRAPLVHRIANKVRIDDETQCWIWLGAYSTKGKRGNPRPVIQLAGRGTPVVPVLRVTLSLRDGVPLDVRVLDVACHLCDNVQCVNPLHGYWGSNASNIRDRMARDPTSFWTKAYRARMQRLVADKFVD